jgi:outer membrane immunogenic protein
MRRILGICAALAFASSASAADLPVKAPAMMSAPAWNWSGFYIGGHVGYGWGNIDVIDGPNAATNLSGIPRTPLANYDVNGIIGGGQVGWNWQAPGSPFVFGIEGDVSASGMDGSGAVRVLGVPAVPPVTASTDINFLATATGRAGYAWSNVLWYVKGGWAYVDQDHSAVAPGVIFRNSDSRSGWTIGTGFEYGFSPNWSAKIEYNYMDFGNRDRGFTAPGVAVPVVVNIDEQIHLVKFGINYRFFGGLGR